MSETVLMRAAALLLLLALLVSLRRVVASRGPQGLPATLLLIAVLMYASAIGLRWQRLGHGPFLSMHEILLSNVFSLGITVWIAQATSRAARAALVFALPVLGLLATWLMVVPARDTALPATYALPVLWLHVAASKLFLGLCLVALSVAVLVALRPRWPALAAASASLATDRLDATAWRFMTAALAAQTLLLIAGAWWAQDAWGRYWAWDPLEAWAFVTWIAAAAALHARLAHRMPARSSVWLLATVFVLAFWTFFGVPFISQAPHKGAV